MNGFHHAGAHKLWKPTGHQAGVTAGGEVTKMPRSFHPSTPPALAATLRHVEGERLPTAVRGKLTRCTDLHKLVRTV